MVASVGGSRPAAPSAQRNEADSHAFDVVLERERAAIQFRRAWIAENAGTGNAQIDEPTQRRARLVHPYADQIRKQARTDRAQRSEDVSAGAGGGSPSAYDYHFTALALSGGGVRSSAFCMGVIQGLDDLSPDGRSDLIDRLDYISAVSGGNYIATALASGLIQAERGVEPSKGAAGVPPAPKLTPFPFASKRDESETRETRFVRDRGTYLAPRGKVDYMVDIAFLLRGWAANAALLAPPILFVAALALWRRPERCDFAKVDFSGAFMIASICVAVALAWTMTFKWAPPDYRSRYFLTPLGGRLVTLAGFAVVVIVGWEVYVALVSAMLEARDAGLNAKPPSGLTFGTGAGQAASTTPIWIKPVSWMIGDVGLIVLPILTALAPLAPKLMVLAESAIADTTFTGAAKRWAGMLGMVAAGLVVPLFLVALLLNLTFIGVLDAHLDWGYAPERIKTIFHWAQHVFGPNYTVAWLYLACGVVLWLVASLFGPNSNSLHQLYRDRLSAAFLMDRKHLDEPDTAMAVPPDLWGYSRLAPRAAEGGGSQPDFAHQTALAPYLLTNATINLQDERLTQHGRRADSFVLSPLSIGSEVTGYARTEQIEARAPRLTIASGMAASGAAASAYMGAETRGILSFGLTVLNIRLGYWVPNPGKLVGLKPCTIRDPGYGPLWFYYEVGGLIDARSNRVYLTDGGHFDNLGLYELLKRRARVIIAVDAECDPAYTFSSFARLQMLARIDFGARLLVPTRELMQERRSPDGAGKAPLRHIAIGRIEYSEKTTDQEAKTGVLIYVKASLSGCESDFLRDFLRRNPSFPHDTTLDQFFSEEQFEAYRQLGFRIIRRFFDGKDDAAVQTFDDRGERIAFAREVREALLTLGLNQQRVDAVMARL